MGEDRTPHVASASTRRTPCIEPHGESTLSLVKQVRVDGRVLVADLNVANNVVHRTRGLMLAKPLIPGQGLEIRPCNSIHMMFMRSRIDAVFFDKQGRVVKVAERLPTWWGLSFGGRKAAGVLELPPGAATGVRVGEQLEWIELPQGGA